ncbi:hypothetical protein SARC_10523 [Sphaeroforma arctica JP610]|uniref:Uncharacterized protein n=1 Tax=Sphaeroforma arctica JP610 TaxID=667725 RepID=A0A0L0FLV6_9EUKA|nr:hypothetical protein SARC_10523 [Sphaeroforma arctica JP610]KNC77003.1 hypothetical protein SARC_10523 [Sphaeroforma arctica JP610]|eukprot:XP_014150905.1 hypothetical protein SARC_10523 [Sphaeroforma arctica JP610]
MVVVTSTTWSKDEKKNDPAVSVDEVAISQLLDKRTAAKLNKKYDEADAFAKELQGMNVRYSDDTKMWYATGGTKNPAQTSPVKVVATKNGKGLRPMNAYELKMKERQRRQSKKNAKKQKMIKASKISKITKFDDFKSDP